MTKDNRERTTTKNARLNAARKSASRGVHSVGVRARRAAKDVKAEAVSVGRRIRAGSKAGAHDVKEAGLRTARRGENALSKTTARIRSKKSRAIRAEN